VLVYVEGRGIVLKEPSVVAVDKITDQIVAVGSEAQALIGRTPANLETIRPMRDGVISQYDVTLRMLQYCIRNACGQMLLPPRVMICVPSGVTEVEERAVVDAAREAGAGKVYLMEEPVAAALGAGVDIEAPVGRMIIDIGGGTTDIAVISMGGVVVSESIRIAGEKLDEAIMRYVRREHGLLIGVQTAELIKHRIGCLYTHKQVRSVEVRGRNAQSGLPEVTTLSSREMLEAMAEPVSAILDAVCSVIERTPPELLGDVLKYGIIMTGGGSMLYGLDQLIANITGIKTKVAENAISCVAIGTGKALERYLRDPEKAISFSKVKKHYDYE
jgi:rod shape-determining protein MreB